MSKSFKISKYPSDKITEQSMPIPVKAYKLVRTSAHRSCLVTFVKFAPNPRQAITNYLEEKPGRDQDWKFIPRLCDTKSAVAIDDFGATITATQILPDEECIAALESSLRAKGDIV